MRKGGRGLRVVEGRDIMEVAGVGSRSVCGVAVVVAAVYGCRCGVEMCGSAMIGW